MEKFDAIKPTGFMLTNFKFVGLWHSKDQWTAREYIHTTALLILFFIIYEILICINLAFIVDLESSSESLFISLTELSLLVKVFNFLGYHRKIRNLLQRIQSARLAPKTEEEVDFFERFHKNFNFQRRMFINICIVCLSSGYVTSILSSEPRLPFPAWFPFDWKSSSRNFWIALLYDIVATTITAINNCCLDLFQAYMLFQISVFFRLLSTRLEAIGQSEVNENGQTKKPPKEELLQCIKMHQQLTSMAQQAEEVVNYPVFIQINISTIVLCFTAFLLTVTSPLQEPLKFISYLYCIGTMLIQILLPCYYGNEIIISSDQVSTAIYSSNWAEMPMHYKRLMFQFLERLKKPMVVSAGGYFPINLNTFMSVIQSAYSLFALIMNLDN
ncbi:unnamed protein product [Hermetia illucens]|uniref:Odorant receptor n=2 Tax=Hermetia illucens TaxID=343691 RepID=A0A7R8V0M3_HERIL|nr:unnamed protein product [Hermetia illucens]